MCKICFMIMRELIFWPPQVLWSCVPLYFFNLNIFNLFNIPKLNINYFEYPFIFETSCPLKTWSPPVESKNQFTLQLQALTWERTAREWQSKWWQCWECWPELTSGPWHSHMLWSHPPPEWQLTLKIGWKLILLNIMLNSLQMTSSYSNELKQD